MNTIAILNDYNAYRTQSPADWKPGNLDNSRLEPLADSAAATDYMISPTQGDKAVLLTPEGTLHKGGGIYIYPGNKTSYHGGSVLGVARSTDIIYGAKSISFLDTEATHRAAVWFREKLTILHPDDQVTAITLRHLMGEPVVGTHAEYRNHTLTCVSAEETDQGLLLLYDVGDLQALPYYKILRIIDDALGH